MVNTTKPSPAKVQVYDLEKGACVFEHVLNSQFLVRIAFGPGERTLVLNYVEPRGGATGCRNLPNYTLELWDTTTSKKVQSWSIEWFLANVVSVRNQLVVGHQDGSRQVLDPADPGAGRILRSSLGEVLSLAVSTDGLCLAVGHRGGQVAIWDTEWWAGNHHAGRQGAPTWSLHFSPDGEAPGGCRRECDRGLVHGTCVDPGEPEPGSRPWERCRKADGWRGELHLTARAPPRSNRGLYERRSSSSPMIPCSTISSARLPSEAGRWELVSRAATNLDRLKRGAMWWSWQ